RNLFHRVTLDGVADLEFAEAFDADAAFHAGTDLVGLVLKAAERLRDTLVNDVFAAAHPHFAAHDATARDHAAGDRNALGQFKNLPHFGGTDNGVLEIRIEQAGHRIFHLVNQDRKSVV